ncbi:MAG: cytochrome c [Microthrixaceae bacterium]|nr:cytochrome c [Acidimicrobiales bacterium]MCB9403473.1 cytochrome c [Microthrixaceae bacterium]
MTGHDPLLVRRTRGGARAVVGASLLAGSLLAGLLLAGCGDDGSAEVKLSAAGQRGKAVAEAKGCQSCHTVDGRRSMGPTWQGLAGSQVQLADGSTVTADDAYIEQAIRDPRSQVRAGFENMMPVAYGDLTEESMADLVAYIREVSGS